MTCEALKQSEYLFDPGDTINMLLFQSKLYTRVLINGNVSY